jgi:hypothetical protein
LAGVGIEYGTQIISATVRGTQIVLQLNRQSHAYNHVILATGYKIDVSRFKLLAADLRRKIACTDGSPMLGAGFESTVPGLHFVGPSSVASYGPLMRFIAGTAYTARSLTQIHLAQTARAKVELLYWRRSVVSNQSQEILRP